MEMPIPTTQQLRIPRNMVRFFKKLVNLVENEKSFDPLTDHSTQEFIFDVPLFLKVDQLVFNQIIRLYQAHYGYHQHVSKFVSDGSDTKMAIELVNNITKLDEIVQYINFLDYYDAPLLLECMIEIMRHRLCAITPPPQKYLDKASLPKDSAIARIYHTEIKTRTLLRNFVTLQIKSNDISNFILRRLWPSIGPMFTCGNDFTIVATKDGQYGFGKNKNNRMCIGENITVAEFPRKIPFDHVYAMYSGSSYSVFMRRPISLEIGGLNKKDTDLLKQKLASLIKEPDFIVDIACGPYYMFILTSLGAVYARGFNREGQIGLGLKMIKRYGPLIEDFVLVQGIKDVVHISCGAYHTMFLTRDGSLFGHGHNAGGELGIGYKSDYEFCFKRVPIEGVINVWCSDKRTMILTKDGLYACGLNYKGVLGLPKRSHVHPNVEDMENYYEIPTRVPLEEVVHVSMSDSMTLILTKHGLYGCGYFLYFSIDTSDKIRNTYYEPTRFSLENVITMACGKKHCAILTKEGLYVCGANDKGQLGLGYKSPHVSVPTRMPAFFMRFDEVDLKRPPQTEIMDKDETIIKKPRTD